MITYIITSTDEPEPESGVYADQDGLLTAAVEPRELHRERRIVELCRGIGERGLIQDWIEELYELLMEVV